MRNIALFLLLSAPLLSCAKRDQPPALEPNPAAEVTAFTGDVRTFSHGEWSAAVVGRVLLAADSIDVPAQGSCELRDAAKRDVALKGAVRGAVSALLQAGARSAPPTRAPIKKLSSLEKLQAAPRFETAAPTAVAGVRGTKGRPQPDTAHQDSSAQN